MLLINNHPTDATSPGQLAALQEMQATGELGRVEAVYAGRRPGESQEQADRRVIEGVRQSRCDLVLTLSMKSRVRDMDGMRTALAGRQVIYWEGDPWGPGKPVGDEMAAWLALSDVTFSVGGPPQWELLRRAGARRMRLTIHTYDHVLFANAEGGRDSPPTHAVTFLGSNLMRIPGLTGLPGSAQRFDLVRRLRQHLGRLFVIGGPGWPRTWSRGRVPFAEQAGFLQMGLVMANWDHYPSTCAYTSDRLAITMISGRSQVTTRHPDMHWLPGPERGLYMADTVSDALTAVRALLESGDSVTTGRAARSWARHRLSHREAVRHMLSTVLDDVEVPPADPWSRLPVWP